MLISETVTRHLRGWVMARHQPDDPGGAAGRFAMCDGRHRAPVAWPCFTWQLAAGEVVLDWGGEERRVDGVWVRQTRRTRRAARRGVKADQGQSVEHLGR